MQASSIISLAILTAVATAKLHNAAVCVTARTSGSTGNGTPYGLGYGSWKEYQIDTDATRCACNYYRNRNTGNNQWDKYPDCRFVGSVIHHPTGYVVCGFGLIWQQDGLQCTSNGWHIGGDEITYYCSEKCGSQGAEAN